MALADEVEDFAHQIEDRSVMEEVKVEETEFGFRIRTITNLEGDEETSFKQKVRELYNDLEEELDSAIPNRKSKEDLVVIRIDWLG